MLSKIEELDDIHDYNKMSLEGEKEKTLAKKLYFGCCP